MFVGSICMLRAVMGMWEANSKDGGAPGAEGRGPAGKVKRDGKAAETKKKEGAEKAAQRECGTKCAEGSRRLDN